jgi:hypothetical protein
MIGLFRGGCHAGPAASVRVDPAAIIRVASVRDLLYDTEAAEPDGQSLKAMADNAWIGWPEHHENPSSGRPDHARGGVYP